VKKPAAKKVAVKKAAKPAGGSLSELKGQGAPEVAGWPFGTKPPEPPAAPPAEPDPDSDDGLTDEQRAGLAPLDYLLAVMRSPRASKSARLQAAIQAAPYMHAKPAPQGKKEAKNEAAKKVARFAPAAPPKLVAAGGKKV
jgi:phage terminase small subunit